MELLKGALFCSHTRTHRVKTTAGSVQSTPVPLVS